MGEDGYKYCLKNIASSSNELFNFESIKIDITNGINVPLKLCGL